MKIAITKNDKSISTIILTSLGQIYPNTNEVNPHDLINIPHFKPIILGSCKETCTFLINSENEKQEISNEHCILIVKNCNIFSQYDLF